MLFFEKLADVLGARCAAVTREPCGESRSVFGQHVLFFARPVAKKFHLENLFSRGPGGN